MRSHLEQLEEARREAEKFGRLAAEYLTRSFSAGHDPNGALRGHWLGVARRYARNCMRFNELKYRLADALTAERLRSEA